MLLFLECLIACALFLLMIKLATAARRAAFVNDYPPVVTDKLRTLGLIAPKPPARRQDHIRKAIAMLVYLLIFALVLRYVNGVRTYGLAALSAYAIWLAVDWFDFAVIDILLAPFDKFYRAAKVSAFDVSAVKFHFLASCRGMLLGLPVSLLAGLVTMILP